MTGTKKLTKTNASLTINTIRITNTRLHKVAKHYIHTCVYVKTLKYTRTHLLFRKKIDIKKIHDNNLYFIAFFRNQTNQIY